MPYKLPLEVFTARQDGSHNKHLYGWVATMDKGAPRNGKLCGLPSLGSSDLNAADTQMGITGFQENFITKQVMGSVRSSVSENKLGHACQ